MLKVYTDVTSGLSWETFYQRNNRNNRCQSSCRLRHPETMKRDGGWGILEDDSLRDKVGMFLVL
jgi:hypothetical protein